MVLPSFPLTRTTIEPGVRIRESRESNRSFFEQNPRSPFHTRRRTELGGRSVESEKSRVTGITTRAGNESCSQVGRQHTFLPSARQSSLRPFFENFRIIWCHDAQLSSSAF